MTSGEPRPGTGPESLAQDPRAEAARLWQAAQVEFGAPADSSAAASPAGLSPRDNDLRMRQEYIERSRGILLSNLDRDKASREQGGHPVSLHQQQLDNSIVVRRKLAELPEQEKEVFLQQQERSVAASLANGIFFSRFEPDDQAFDRIRAIYTPEDTERIMGILNNRILSYLRNNSIPVSDYHENGSNKYGPAELEDYRWLGRWRNYFEENPQPGITPPSKDHWDYRIREVEAQIVAAGGVVAPEGEPSVQNVEAIQKAREVLTTMLDWYQDSKTEHGKINEQFPLREWAALVYADELRGYNDRARAARLEELIKFGPFGTHAVATKLFEGKVLPSDPLRIQVHQLYASEDEREIFNQVAGKMGGLQVSGQQLSPQDRQWVEAWERHFERLARPSVEDTELVPADPVQEARERLESELTAIGEFFEGKKPVRGYLEDWQAAQIRRQGRWIKVDYLAEDVNKWLENRIAPLIFQARLRGDDQIAKDLVNLCSPDQFDTLILAVGQLLKEATAKG